jgi:hypothetical protein
LTLGEETTGGTPLGASGDIVVESVARARSRSRTFIGFASITMVVSMGAKPSRRTVSLCEPSATSARRSAPRSSVAPNRLNSGNATSAPETGPAVESPTTIAESEVTGSRFESSMRSTRAKCSSGGMRIRASSARMSPAVACTRTGVSVGTKQMRNSPAASATVSNEIGTYS